MEAGSESGCFALELGHQQLVGLPEMASCPGGGLLGVARVAQVTARWTYVHRKSVCVQIVSLGWFGP